MKQWAEKGQWSAGLLMQMVIIGKNGNWLSNNPISDLNQLKLLIGTKGTLKLTTKFHCMRLYHNLGIETD